MYLTIVYNLCIHIYLSVDT